MDGMDDEEDGTPERHLNIHFSPEIMAGVYANFANVSHSDYEFTVTFERADVCLAGNHDMVITGEIGLEAFSSDARTAAEWTMEVLAADDLERLRSLEPKGERGGVELYHGSIRDPVWEYVIDDRTAAVCLELQGTRLSLVGHSHVPLAYGYLGEKFLGGLAGAGTRLETRPGPFLLNPGSV